MKLNWRSTTPRSCSLLTASG
jgi:hypothetical protein